MASDREQLQNSVTKVTSASGNIPVADAILSTSSNGGEPRNDMRPGPPYSRYPAKDMMWLANELLGLSNSLIKVFLRAFRVFVDERIELRTSS